MWVLLGTKIQQFPSNFHIFIGTLRFVRIFPIHVSLLIQVFPLLSAHDIIFSIISCVSGWIITSWVSSLRIPHLVTSFLLRHCLILPCLFHFQPLCLFTTTGPHPRSPLCFSLPRCSLNIFWSFGPPCPQAMPHRWLGLLPTQKRYLLASIVYWFKKWK